MIRRNLLILIMISVFSALFGRAVTPRLEHVHPLNWWTGMQETTLQVMLHGNGIGDCDVTLTQAKGVEIIKVERVENQNYLFVYLDLKNAQPHTFGIALTKPGKKKPLLTHPYTLNARDGVKPQPFSSADVMYLLMPDRFIDGDLNDNPVKGVRERVSKNDDWGRHGGDLKGMRVALDYLQELGVTALWPTPVQVNDQPEGSYHGYAITDYYQIDPRIGSNEEYRNFVAECHQHGIKMVMDLVFNHCGSENFLFKDLPQKDWFNFDSKYVQSAYRTAAVNDIHASKYDRERTTDGWFVPTMPDFNQKNPLVKDYLIQTSIWWTEYAKIDGIRQDTYPYADLDMMREWCMRLDKEYPGYNVVGETWINNNVGVSWWQKDSKLAAPVNTMLPTVMDFPLMSLLNQVVDEETDDWNNGFAKIYEYIAQDCVYANPLNLLTFLDNHDTDRFHKTKELAENSDRYFQALTLLLTLRGIPQLYYGDEVGMWSNKANGDGPNRQNFPIECLTEMGRYKIQKVLFNFTKNLLNWRKNCKAVQFGSLTHFCVRNGCYVYARQLDGKTVTVILNGTSKYQTLELEPYAEVLPGTSVKDVISGENVTLGKKIDLKPRQILILDF